MQKHRRTTLVLSALLIAALGATARGGPPFLTDDPEPVEYGHGELYLFSILDAMKGSTTVQVPAVEFNYGIAEETQLHVIAPLTAYASDGHPTEYGIGDMQLGIKYRFLKETDDFPQIGIFPLLNVASGDPTRGLGNGSNWAELPIWAQKSWGKWTTYGGGGYAINSAVGHSDYFFGGWLLQRKVTDKLAIGGEIFCQGADGPDSRSSTLFNLGGIYDVNDNIHLLFSGGYTLAGEQNTPGYLAIQYTW